MQQHKDYYSSERFYDLDNGGYCLLDCCFACGDDITSALDISIKCFVQQLYKSPT